MKYAGIDVSAHFHVVAVLDESMFYLASSSAQAATWRRSPTFRIENKRADFEHLKQMLGPPGDVAIGLEPTGYYYSLAIAEYLARAGYDVFYVDGVSVHDCRKRFFKSSSKNDAIDARVIAAILFYNQVIGEDLGVNPASVELESHAAAIRALALQQWSLTRDKTRLVNRLRQLLVAVFPEGERAYFAQLSGTARREKRPPVLLRYAPTPDYLLALAETSLASMFEIAFPRRNDRAKVLDLARETIGADPNIHRATIKLLAEQLDSVLTYLETVKGVLEQRVNDHPYGSLLLSIPASGVGDAAWIIGTIGDINLYPTKKKLRKALGCYVEDAQSGETVGSSQAGKSGNRNAKRAISLWTLRLLKEDAPDNPVRDLYQRRTQAGRDNNLAAARGRLVGVVWSVLHNRRPFSYPAQGYGSILGSDDLAQTEADIKPTRVECSQ
jgi:transposase